MTRVKQLPIIAKYGRKIRVANTEEAQLVNEAMANGWIVYNKGWPDFLLVRGTELAMVEIKHNPEALSKPQKQVIRLLRRCGLDVYVSTGELPNNLIWFPDKNPKGE